MNTLKTGDIVNIKNKTPLLVVRSERVVSEDRIRGDSYSVDEIDCIEIPPKFDITKMVDVVFEGGNPKQFYFEGGSMSGSGKKIRISDVKVLAHAKLKTYVTTSYEIGKVKHF